MGVDTEGDVRVDLSLRNPEGDNSEIELRQHLLGLEGYILITAEIEDDDTVFKVEASHTNLDDLLAVAYVLTSMIETHQGRPPIEDRIRAVLEEGARQTFSIDPLALDVLVDALVEAVEG